MGLGSFFMVVLSAVLVNNFVVVQFLGICPFLGMSKRLESSVGMGIAVTLVMAVTCLITYPLYTYVLVPLGLAYLEIIVFIFVIAALVQMIEQFIKKFMPPLYRTMGIYLPLITTNCAVLGVAEMVIDEGAMLGQLGIASMNLGAAVLYGVFAGVGFTAAIVILAGLRMRVDYLDMPSSVKGMPATMITACFIAMGFYVFNLIG